MNENEYEEMRSSLESLVTGVETFIAHFECDMNGSVSEDYRELFNCINNKLKVARNALAADKETICLQNSVLCR